MTEKEDPYKQFEVTDISEEKYPEYKPFQKIERDEECWERYASRIKEMKESGKEFTYPLDKNAYIFYPQHEYHKCLVTTIKPSKFIELAKPKAHIRACSLDYLLDAFEYGDPLISPVYLSVNPKYCNVNGHEGRHRAEIANDLDIDEIPITICYYGDYTLMEKDESGKEVVDYDAMEEADKEMKAVFKGKKEGNLFDTMNKILKDKWSPPKDWEGKKCTINHMGKEGKSMFDGGIDFKTVAKKRTEYRKKFGLED